MKSALGLSGGDGLSPYSYTRMGFQTATQQNTAGEIKKNRKFVRSPSMRL